MSTTVLLFVALGYPQHKRARSALILLFRRCRLAQTVAVMNAAAALYISCAYMLIVHLLIVIYNI
jgi:hypothetical protein